MIKIQLSLKTSSLISNFIKLLLSNFQMGYIIVIYIIHLKFIYAISYYEKHSGFLHKRKC